MTRELREAVERTWRSPGGQSEPVHHGKRIASEASVVRTIASCHETAATWGLCPQLGTPGLTSSRGVGVAAWLGTR